MIRIGGFELGERLGAGATGAVWGGIHVATGTPVAIKAMAAPATPEFVRAFRDEVRAVAALGHPGIVEVYDQGVLPTALDGAPAGAPYLVMERMDGTLASRRDASDWPRLRGALLALLDALAHAHARGVLHRDIKPANVLVRSGALKLADFGLAHPFGIHVGAGREEQLVAGTPRYMAPEQFEHRWRDYGPWTDLYALGCLAWELATGAPPFPVDGWLDGMVRHLSHDPPSFAPRHPMPPRLEPWLRTLLRKRPAGRFRCAADAASALLEVGDAPGTSLGEVGDRPLASAALTTLDLPAPTGARAPPPGDPIDDTPPAVAFVPRWTPALRAPPRPLSGAGLGLVGLRAVPFVGRAAERTTLWQALGRVHRDREAAVVVLRGPAGAGKSSLARWCVERAYELGAASPVRVSFDGASPGSPGVEGTIARHLRTAGLTAEQVGARIDELLAARVPAAGRALLAAVLAPGAAQPPRAVLEAALLWLGALCRERPVVLWLDDAHADPTALAFAAAVRDAEPPLPVLVVATVQDEALAESPDQRRALAALLAHSRAVEVTVAPLSPAQHRQLVDALLDIDDALAGELAERTAGNPLFAVELVRDWVERGVLVSGPRGFRIADGADTTLPAALSEVWNRRLDRLLRDAPPDDGAVLELAALLGPEFDESLWHAAATRAGATVRPGLREAVLERSLAVAREPGVLVWCHGMLVECLRDRARRHGRWARLNACAAAALAAAGMAWAERAAARFDAVGDGEGAMRALGDAAAWRLHRGVDPGPLLDALEARFDSARVAPSDPRRGRAATLRMFAAYGRGAFAEAEALGGPLLAAAERYGWTGVAERTCVGLAALARLRLEPDAAIALLDRVVDRGGGAYASAILALVEAEHRHRHRLALARAERAAAEAAAPTYRALTASVLAMVEFVLGDPERAERAAAWAEALNRAMGSWSGRSGIALLEGDMAARRGDLGEARSALLRGVVYARRSGGVDEVLWAELNLAHLELRAGRWREALDRLGPHREAFAAAPRMRAEAEVLRAVGLGGIGRWDAAERALAEAAGLLRGTPVVVPRLGTRALELAELASVAGRGALAREATRFAADQQLA